ncbi:MAG: CoA transferase [Proteobacteria bacterium]|nr:CoA transferase [Pseudomonadota bacterium]
MAGPLSHIRILDLSRILAGPWAGQVFADLGAEVIKVERPGTGDDTRGWGPPFLTDSEGNPTSDAAYFLSANRGKKSVTIDFTKPEGRDLICQLASQADIIIENFKVGGLSKYGLDYESIKKICPKIIYCSITGFGQTGPYSHRTGYDFLIQSMGGLMSITGAPDDEPGGGPMKVGVAVVDIFTGMYASTAILAALTHRERTGEGQYIDLSLLDVQVATLANQAMNYLVTGKSPVRRGNAHPNIVPYQACATADGHIVLTVGNDEQFHKLCVVANRPELSEDERFATNEARVCNREILMPILLGILKGRSSSEWIQALGKARVPCGPINTLHEVFTDPQVLVREMRIELEHPLAGTVPLVGNPMKFSATPVVYDRVPPLLGDSNDEILCDLLGLDKVKYTELQAAGVIGEGTVAVKP